MSPNYHPEKVKWSKLSRGVCGTQSSDASLRIKGAYSIKRSHYFAPFVELAGKVI